MGLRIETFKTIKNKFRLFTQVLCFSFCIGLAGFTRFYPGRLSDSPKVLSWKFRMKFQIRKSARIHIGLQFILIVIWYTFSDFDISNKSFASAAAKINKIFEIAPQMYKKLNTTYSMFRTVFRTRIVCVNAAFKTPLLPGTNKIVLSSKLPIHLRFTFVQVCKP